MDQYWYVFGCIRLYLFVLYLFLYVFVCIIDNIDFFESDAMGTRGVGTGGKCILTVFGKRNTAAGGPTYRVSALTCFSSLDRHLTHWHCRTFVNPARCMPHEDRR